MKSMHWSLVVIILMCTHELFAQKDELNFKVSNAVSPDVNLEDSIFYTMEDAIKAPLRVRQLNLESKHLKVLPSAVLTFTNLQALDISHNRISNLPDSLFIACLKLEELRYEGNDLTEIPSSVYRSSLKLLDLSENHITVVPDQIGECKRLEELDMHANDITMLPTKHVILHHLKSLILSDNPLIKTGEWMFHQPRLQILFLDDTQLQQLDDSFCKATNLRLLNIEGNALKKLPDCVCHLKGLRIMMLGGNQFESTMQDELLKCLPHLLVR